MSCQNSKQKFEPSSVVLTPALQHRIFQDIL